MRGNQAAGPPISGCKKRNEREQHYGDDGRALNKDFGLDGSIRLMQGFLTLKIFLWLYDRMNLF